MTEPNPIQARVEQQLQAAQQQLAIAESQYTDAQRAVAMYSGQLILLRELAASPASEKSPKCERTAK